MTERFTDEDVRTRLILSGMSEIEEHGIRDFSLRHAAELAGVSCAAPYRYFKSKENYIASIFRDLASKWALMFREISNVYKNDAKTMICELCLANIRFWLANKNLRSALLLSDDGGGEIKISDFDMPIVKSLRDYYGKAGYDAKDTEKKILAVRSLIYGYITLIGSGEAENANGTIFDIESEILKKL